MQKKRLSKQTSLNNLQNYVAQKKDIIIWISTRRTKVLMFSPSAFSHLPRIISESCFLVSWRHCEDTAKMQDAKPFHWYHRCQFVQQATANTVNRWKISLHGEIQRISHNAEYIRFHDLISDWILSLHHFWTSTSAFSCVVRALQRNAECWTMLAFVNSHVQETFTSWDKLNSDHFDHFSHFDQFGHLILWSWCSSSRSSVNVKSRN